MKHNVIILFEDGNDIVISECDEFSVTPNDGYATIVKNKHRIIVNFAKVKCIGYEEDING